MMSIGEYCARVLRLRLVIPDLESDYNDDEGLTLSWNNNSRDRVVFTGEPSIIEAAEAMAKVQLQAAVLAFDQPVVFARFK